jgi:hypothetical protein
MTIASELLDAAVAQQAKQIDEKLYLELFAMQSTNQRGRAKTTA